MLAHATVAQVIKYTPRVGGLCIYIYELQRLHCPYFKLTMHSTTNITVISNTRKTSMVATAALRAGLTSAATGLPHFAGLFSVDRLVDVVPHHHMAFQRQSPSKLGLAELADVGGCHRAAVSERSAASVRGVPCRRTGS